MDQLMRQFGGQGNLNDIMNGIMNNEEGDGVEEELDEETLMQNCKITYDVFIKNNLECTSHSLQWLPTRSQDPDNSQFYVQNFLIGTHYSEDHGDMFGNDSIQIAQIKVPKYDQNQKSVIDYTKLPKNQSKVQIVKQFNHQGEVNKCRAMPQDWRVIASLGNDGDVFIYKHDETNQIQSDFKTLTGLQDEGFGIQWNSKQQGLLAAATGTSVCIWDVDKCENGAPTVIILDAHEDTINDLKFSPLNQNLYGTASDDHHFKLWDVRAPLQFLHCYKASDDDLFVISFNYDNEYVFATGGEKSGALHVWDMRMAKHYINDLYHHKAQVNQIEWSPTDTNLFMSSSTDGKLFVWDHSKTGEEQARHDYEDGPPELIFPHEYHKNGIEDIAWSIFEDQKHFAASCDTDGSLQVWKMSQNFIFDEMDYYDQLESIKNEEVE
ncbi:histone-binding protein rbbp4-like [Stylonychia lemnae]|uniref:Histone-binding protein rbbp4-like n=1 Tax=Stylonychia lemnae TaxID=5949 RepID=A0A078A955_STYLE|nr:histone-binding protein rbbp4-like [Stylonychia lemnae]|eukprot:CDW78759.1 histone-binding protein rbbp4-like [Stylonychia lemnae]